MPTIETIRRITLQQESKGGAAARADLQATADAQAKLGEAVGATAVVTELASRRQLSAASAFDRLRMSVDGSYKAMVAQERGLNTISRALQNGATDAETAGRVMDLLGAKFSGAAEEARAFEAAQRAAARATIQAREAQEAAASAFQQSINKRLGVGGGGSGSDRAADFEAAAAAGDRLRAKYDAVFAAAQRYAATVKEVTEAERAGILTADIAGEARLKATRGYNDQIQVLERLGQAQKEAAQRSVNSQTVVPDRGADIEAYAAELNKLQAEFDPVFRATQTYEAYVGRLTMALNTGAIEQGVFTARLDEAKAAYDAQIASINGVVEVQTKAARSVSELRAAWAQLGEQGRTTLGNIQASNKLGSLSYTGGNVQNDAAMAAARAEAEKAAEAQAAAQTKMRAALVPMFAVTEQFAAAQDLANKALEAGVISQDEYTAAINRARNVQLAQTNELKKAEDANARLAKGVGLSAYGWQNLSFQVNDVITSLAAGISPMQTLAQQGGQIFQVLQGGNGGVKGALLGIADSAKGVAARVGLVGGAIGGVTAAVLVGVAAQQSYSSTQTALARDLSGVGRASGATASQINAIASASAAAGDVSVRSAREMAGTFAATGRIGTEMYGGLIGTVKDYAATTGQEVPTATKALAEAFADPAKGADILDKQLGILSDTTRENIQQLLAQGNRLGAQKVLFDAYKNGLTSATELTSAWSRATAAAGKTISDAWDAIGGAVDKVVTGGTLDEQLATAQKVLQMSRARSAGMFGSILPGVASRDEKIAQGDVDRLREELRKRDQKIQDAQRNEISSRIGGYVRELNPAEEQIKAIERRAKDIADNLRNLPLDEQGAARRAMEGLVGQAKQLREDMAAGGASFADATRQAQFGNRTVGFTPQGMSAAQIEQEAENRRIAARRNQQEDPNLDKYVNSLASIERDRKIQLDTLSKQTTLEGNQAGAAFSRMTPEAQAQLQAGAQRFGRVPVGVLAAIAQMESRGDLDVGYTKEIDENGKKGTAYGLGQITKSTGDDLQRRYGIDRMNRSTMGEALAGVLDMKLDATGGDLTKAIMAYRGSSKPGVNEAYAAKVLRDAGQMGDPSTTAQVREQDAATRALRDQKEQLANYQENLGKNGLALEATAEATKRYNALLDSGVPASDALAASIKGLAMQSASTAQQMKLTQFASDTGFQRDQLGRTQQEQAAYSQARSLIGDTSSPQAQFVIEQSKSIDTLRQIKDAGQGAFSGIITDLSHGTSLANSFSSALNKIGDKLISFGTDAIFSKLFGSVLGGGSGAGGGGFDLLGGIGKIFGFADGGYTGAGGKYEPAGIVHRGEYVIDAGTVGRIGRGFFDGLRGYADGGFVDMPDRKAPLTPIPANMNSTTSSVDARSYSIDLRGSTLTREEVRTALQQAIAQNNTERDRTSQERNEMLRRAAF